jgi:hypothetical protein
MSLQTVRDGRDMPFIKRGMRVQVYNGKFGVISSSNSQMNLNVRLDGEKQSTNYHPQWKMKYFDDKGNVIAEYKD